MNGAPSRNGAPVAHKGGVRPFLRRRRRHGFTLLEMCVVLLIIALLFGLSAPSLQTAMTEQTVRHDAHQLALMVKTAMIQSTEQHRAYAIDLTTKSMALHPVGVAAADTDSTGTDDTTDTDSDADASGNVTMPDVTITTDLDSSNKLLVPDPDKANAWMAIPDGTQWVFQPGELCPATLVRFGHGEAWLQMTFDALTGNVDQETFSIQ
jgi:prepilin-type N-terminal cleavage/methylation domain-containing protein